jgi:hypothetical protein
MSWSVFSTSLESSRITICSLRGQAALGNLLAIIVAVFEEDLIFFGTVFLSCRKKLVEPFGVPVIWYLFGIILFYFLCRLCRKKIQPVYFSVVWIHKYFFLIRILNYGSGSGRPIYYWSGSESYLEIFVATSGFRKVMFLNRYGSKLLQTLHPKPEALRVACPSRN